MIWLRQIKTLIRRMIRSETAHWRTSFPAQVESYDNLTNTAKIQPCIQAIRVEDADNLTTINLTVLEDVFVKQRGSGKLWGTVAPAAGSYGVVHVSDRCIEQWALQGGVVAPGSGRRFDMSDAIFDPGLVTLTPDGDNGALVVPVATDRISLRTRDGLGLAPTAEISVVDDGTVDINGTATVINDGSDWAVQYTALKAAFDQLKNDFNTLVILYNAHVHTGVTTGVGSTGITPPGAQSAADMTAAKVATVNLP